MKLMTKTCAYCRQPIPKDSNYRKKKYCNQVCMGKSYHTTPRECFESKVDLGPHPKGCWHWIGSIKPRNGYGHCRIAGKDYNAHRLAYELLVGPIPAGAHVLHSCDVPHCVNPAHLRLGTHQENMAEMWAKRRMPTKYTPETISEIRRRATGKNDKELAAEFGTVPRYIWGIRTRSNWKDVQ